MTPEPFLLTGLCFLVWILWIPAVLIQMKARGKEGGMSIAPIIPFFPLAAVLVGLGLNLWISHLGTWIIGGLHSILGLSFVFTIVVGLFKISRMPDETAEPTCWRLSANSFPKGTHMKPDETPLDESAGPLFEKYHRALEERDFDSATETVEDIFALAVKWCEENPSPDFDLTLAAGEFEECGDWRSAEAMYGRILSLPDITPGTEYKAHSDLASLCQLLHRDADALDHAQRATVAARRDDFPLLLLMALHDEAWGLIRCGRDSEASALVAEGFAIMEHDETCDLMRAQFLMLRAQGAIQSGSIAEAEPDLEQAYRLLEPLAALEMAAGVHGTLSCWWSQTARLRAERGDKDGAISAWRKAIEISKHVASTPQVVGVYTTAGVAAMLKGLADALSAADRTKEAAVVLEEREELLERIGIPDTGS